MEAEVLFRRCLNAQDKVDGLGPDHEDTVKTVRNLGNLLGLVARYDEAEPLLQRALSSREKMFGSADVRTNDIRSDLNGLEVARKLEASRTLREQEALIRRQGLYQRPIISQTYHRYRDADGPTYRSKPDTRSPEFSLIAGRNATVDLYTRPPGPSVRTRTCVIQIKNVEKSDRIEPRAISTRADQHFTDRSYPLRSRRREHEVRSRGLSAGDSEPQSPGSTRMPANPSKVSYIVAQDGAAPQLSSNTVNLNYDCLDCWESFASISELEDHEAQCIGIT